MNAHSSHQPNPVHHRRPPNTPQRPASLETPEIDTSDDPLWYSDAVIYQLHVKAFLDSQQRRHGRLPGPDRKARLRGRAGRQHDLAAAVLPVAAARRRLRHRRVRGRQPALRHHATTSATMLRRRARARPARDHRAGHQPHLEPAPAGSRRARSAAGLARAQLLRVERHRPDLPGHADHLHRHRELELDLGPGRRASTSGTASSPTSPTSTSTTPRCVEAGP